MAKTPRLKFFGVTATRKEIDLFIDACTWSKNPATDNWSGGMLRIKPGALYVGKAFGEVIDLMHKHGFLVYDKRMRGNVWTPLAVRYITAVMRNNPRLRADNTWRYISLSTARKNAAARKRAKAEAVLHSPYDLAVALHTGNPKTDQEIDNKFHAQELERKLNENLTTK